MTSSCQFDRGASRVEAVDESDATPRDRRGAKRAAWRAFSNGTRLLINGTGEQRRAAGIRARLAAREAQPVRIAEGVGVALSPVARKALGASVQTHAPRVSIVPTGAGQPQTIDLGSLEFISSPGWLPDGRLVVQTVGPGGGFAVSVPSAAGRDAAALLPPGMTLPLTGSNVISPDGSRILASDSAGRSVVCTIVSPACQALSGMKDDDVISGWSADGQSLFVYQPRPEVVQIDRVEVRSGRRSAWKTVRPLGPAVSGFIKLIVSPDGAIAYGYSRSRSQLYVIKGLK